jgi:hypothetical protein
VTLGRELELSQRSGDLVALIRCLRFLSPCYAVGLLLLRVLRSHRDDVIDGVARASPALPGISNSPKPRKFCDLALLRAECDTKRCILACWEVKPAVRIGGKESSSKGRGEMPASVHSRPLALQLRRVLQCPEPCWMETVALCLHRNIQPPRRA